MLGCPWQRYAVDFLREALGHVGKDQHGMVAALLRPIFTPARRREQPKPCRRVTSRSGPDAIECAGCLERRRAMPHEIEVPMRYPEQFRDVLPRERYLEVERGGEEARELLAGRVVWNVNSTARGGGVVELLRPLIGYARGMGLDARWVVINGTTALYGVTKRMHNRLHGFEGDGAPRDAQARRIYEDTLANNTAAFVPRVRPGDIVSLHDPQLAGMAPALRPLTAALIWRCHVGVDEPNDLVRETWSFLQPYVSPADVCVFSRDDFVWEGLERRRVAMITPTIDVFTPKNDDLAPETVLAVLQASAVVADGPAP